MADCNSSVFTVARQTSADVSELVGALDNARQVMGETDRWKISTGGFWRRVNNLRVEVIFDPDGSPVKDRRVGQYPASNVSSMPVSR